MVGKLSRTAPYGSTDMDAGCRKGGQQNGQSLMAENINLNVEEIYWSNVKQSSCFLDINYYVFTSFYSGIE